MSTPSRVHQSATAGFENAEAYDAHRPTYPADAVQRLLDNLRLTLDYGNAKVIDLAAGTGKFTEILAAKKKYQIIAVEPLASMRGTLEAKGLEGVVVKEGTAESMDVEDGWADAVIVAQAFQWFATMEALREIARVLKPGGKLGLIWNVDDYNKPSSWPASTPWEQSLNELVFGLPDDGQARFRDYRWKDVFDREKPAQYTPHVLQDKTSWTVRLGIEALWERMHTLSQIAMLKGMERDTFREKFEEIVRQREGATSEDEEVEIHGVTMFAWIARGEDPE